MKSSQGPTDSRPTGDRKKSRAHVSIPIWIRPEHLDKIAGFFEAGYGFGHFGIGVMAVAIHKKEILPSFALAGSRLDFGHVQFEPAKGRQRVIERTHFVRDAEHDAGAVATGGRSALAAQD